MMTTAGAAFRQITIEVDAEPECWKKARLGIGLICRGRWHVGEASLTSEVIVSVAAP